MPRLPSFTVTSTPKGWRVRVPASVSDTGKDQARFFKSRRLAESFAQEQRSSFRANGENHSVLPPRVADDALAAWKLVEPFGITLLAAARDAIARRVMIDQSLTVSKAAAKWLKMNEHEWRPPTLESYTSTTKLLIAEHKDTSLATLTGDQLEACIRGKSFALHRRNLSAFLNWCAASPRRWCDPAVLKDIPKAPSKKDHDISVLCVEEVRALLTAAETHYPEIVPIYAIGFFGGVRVEERGRLDSCDMTEDGIDIGITIAKKRRRRFVPLSPSLVAWLTAYPFAKCSNLIEKDKACRRLAGWDVSARILKNPPIPHRGPWPHNVIRHTHASAEIAHGAALEDLLFRFGHTSNSETLRSHYVGRYTKREAAEFFEIRPALKNVISEKA